MTNVAAIFAAREAERQQRTRAPYLGSLHATIFVAMSVVIMSYSGHFKIWPPLLYFALWFSTLALKGFRLLRITRAMLLSLALPTLCFASTLWSDYPGSSVYLGTAFVIVAFCIIIMNRAVAFKDLLMGLLLGADIALLITLANGSYGFDVMSGTYSLTGLFGSKNEVGFTAELGLILSFALCVGRLNWKQRMVAIGSMVLCIYCMKASHSGTSLLSLIVTLTAMGFCVMMGKIPSGLRAAFWGLSMLILVATTGTILATGGQDVILKSLGKDPTLTGRTYLWHEGIAIGKLSPIWGHGYSAFWVQGNPLAERYWHEFFIDARGGFHFHSIYVQCFVDLGVVGLALIGFLVLTNCISSSAAIIRGGVTQERLLLFGLSLMFAIRSWVEVDFFVGPFCVGAMIFYGIYLRLADARQLAAHHAA